MKNRERGPIFIHVGNVEIKEGVIQLQVDTYEGMESIGRKTQKRKLR